MDIHLNALLRSGINLGRKRVMSVPQTYDLVFGPLFYNGKSQKEPRLEKGEGGGKEGRGTARGGSSIRQRVDPHSLMGHNLGASYMSHRQWQ